MDRLKKGRTVARSEFTRVLTNLRVTIENDVPDVLQVQTHFALLKDKASELEDFNTRVLELMMDENASEEDLGRDVLSADEYRSRYQQVKVEVLRIVNHQPVHIQHSPQHIQEIIQQVNPLNENRRTFRLPNIEVKKFSGDVKESLQFWSQFKHIHEDDSVSREEKFQHLIQAMMADSRASELVNSYPPTAANYDKVINSLKNRFGKNELLVEVYVRELLKLVLNNAMSKGKMSLASIYDKLETHIRSLESLGVTTDTCAAMLHPLVESSLPEELLRTWQRHMSTVVQYAPREPGNDAPAVPVIATPKDRLVNLMVFIQAEVENEERIAMAVSGFGINQDQTIRDKSKKKQKAESYNEIATASALLTTKENKRLECIFCNDNHDSSQCEDAKKKSLEERQEIVKRKNACFNCLKTGHNRRFCKYSLKCAWCGRKHVLLMCRGIISGSSTTKKLIGDMTAKQEESSLANLSLNTEVFLQTLRVKIHNNGKERIVRAVLDTGSHRSYVVGRMAKELDYEAVGQQNIIHLLFGGVKTEPQEHKGYRIRLSSLDNSYACNFVALGQDTICHNIPGIPQGPWIQELSQKGIQLTDVGHGGEPIVILIGADIVGKIMTGNLHYLKCGATAIETLLGWTVMGKNSHEKTSRVDSALLAVNMFVQEAKVSELWSLDVLGITDPVHTESKEEHQKQVIDLFRQTVKVDKTGRYEVLLPWKENHPTLSDNKELAIKRLEINTKRLKSENLFEDYCQVLEEWMKEGIIERVPHEETNNQGYYLPHRHVVKENSTTRLRPVFDASAKGKSSPSLNQCLETGPNLIEIIPTILLKFREKRIGVISDIKKAFLQISVTPKDRDVLRFLWWSNEDPNVLEIYRHRRVVFGVTSSPFLLGATIDFHLEQKLQERIPEEHITVLQTLQKSFYVDNCVTSVNTNEDLYVFKKVATTTMSTGGFSPKSLPKKITKRVILSITQKIFDPIGLVSPVVLRPKLLLQRLWASDLDWDTEVEKSIKDEFNDWHDEIHLLKGLEVPRWAFGDDLRGDSTSFHVFVDASQNAYAAVLFARTETSNGNRVQLIEAKARVVPLGKATISRLELLAATIGTRLMSHTHDVLGRQQAEKRFWSDSSIVLSWIIRDNQWATFVCNRVKEIRQYSKSDHWHHVPGTLNPADLPSRGCSVKQLLQSKWWEGPEWLAKSPDHWPSSNYLVNEAEVSDEIKKSTIRTVSNQCNLVMSNTNFSIPRQEDCWYLKGFSKYSKILRMTAWVLRFINKCQKRRLQFESGDLTVKEITEAESTLMRLSQSESFKGVDDPRISSLKAFKDKSGLIPRVKKSSSI